MVEEFPTNFVYSVTASPTFAQDGVCFAAQQSGLFRSTDGGKTWQNAYQSLDQVTPPTTHAVAFSPDFTHDRTVFAAVQGGILRSTDNGEHWKVTLLPSPPPVASGLVVSPNFLADGQAFCATVEDGVFITQDRGSRWATWNFGLIDLQILCLAASPQYSQNEFLIAGAESGIYRSKNGGRAWKMVDLHGDSAPVTSLAFSPVFESDLSIFAGTLQGDLYHSQDRGNTWVSIAKFKEEINQILLGTDFHQKPELLLLVGSTLHYSTNRGQNWKKRGAKSRVDDYITCVAAPHGISMTNPILAGTIDHGVVLI